MDFRVVGVTVYPKPHRHRAFNHTSGISVIYLKITKKSYNQQKTEKVMKKGNDYDIDVYNIPDKAFVVYWDSEHKVIDNCVIYAETVAPLSLIEAIKVFRPEFAKGANITFQYISGTLSITNIMKF